MKKIPRGTSLALLSLFALASAKAGIVTWSAAQNIAGDTDVSTAGTLVSAYNLGVFGNSSATVNGVTFAPFITSGLVNTTGNVTLTSTAPIGGDNTAFGDPQTLPFASLTANYQTLLQSGSFATGTIPPVISMALNGLTPNAQYQFQWWATAVPTSSFDPLFPAPPGLPSTTATAGNSVTLQQYDLAGNLGQFATGVFTATTATQLIDFQGASSRTLLNGFQLRQLGGPAIPEPGSCLFGLALAGIVFRSASSRRRPVTR